MDVEENTSPSENKIAKAKVITTHAFNKCSISVSLNFIILIKSSTVYKLYSEETDIRGVLLFPEGNLLLVRSSSK